MIFAMIFLVVAAGVLPAVADEIDDELASYAEENHDIPDPLEPLNRFFFQFNDKMYFYVLKPVARGYGAVVPEDIRVSIGNAFHNLLTPIRVVNNLLQGKFAASGTELMRFVINTTAGAGGLGDPAKEVFGLEDAPEDLGQTLGRYGVGEGIYFCWPFLGPSNLRDTVGLVGDTFLNPLFYLADSDSGTAAGLQAGKIVNKTSLNIGEYEQFIESSIDPYVAMRDFYTQHRRSLIEDKVESGGGATPGDMGQRSGHAPHDRTSEQTTARRRAEALAAVPEAGGAAGKMKVDGTFYVVVREGARMSDLDSAIDALIDHHRHPVVVQESGPGGDLYRVLVPAGANRAAASEVRAALAADGYAPARLVRL